MKKIALISISFLLGIMTILSLVNTVSATGTPIPGRHCIMRATIPIDDYAEFGLDAGTTTIERGSTVGDEGSGAALTTGMWGLLCMIGTMSYITNIIFWFLAPLFVILAIIGAFFIMTAAGDADKVKKGKNFILYAAIGFVLVIFVRAIPAMIRFIVGM